MANLVIADSSGLQILKNNNKGQTLLLAFWHPYTSGIRCLM